MRLLRMATRLGLLRYNQWLLYHGMLRARFQIKLLLLRSEIRIQVPEILEIHETSTIQVGLLKSLHT